MPRIQPSQSWQSLRNYMEKFSWRDLRTNLLTTGYNPPQSAKEINRVPFFVRYVTGKGILEQGNAICLKVNRRKHLRMIQFIDSQEIRWIRDYLVIEVDGTKIITN